MYNIILVFVSSITSTAPWYLIYNPSGFNCAFPRDIWMVVGNEIIEAPMAWYSRFFEYTAYRSLTAEYVKKGATVVSGPKPRMDSNFFDQV